MKKLSLLNLFRRDFGGILLKKGLVLFLTGIT